MTIVVLFLGALARTELIPLAIVPPLAVVWHEWSWALRDQTRARVHAFSSCGCGRAIGC